MPGIPLRRRLLALAAAGIVPIAAMSAIGFYLLLRHQQVQAERVGLELARALATAVDAELRSSTSVLEALATTAALDRNDTSGFRERAQRVLNTQPNWAAVLLADPAGHRLMDTRFASPAPQPLAEPLSFDTVVRTRAPAVGNLAKGLDGSLLFPVRVPVLRNGELRYVLTAVVKPEEILDVVKRQRVPSDWVISVFDANGLRVARSRAHDENLGGRAAASLQALMASGADEGVGQTYALEGDRIYTAYSRLKDSRWSVIPGIPASLVEGAFFRSLIFYAGGLLVSIVLGTLAAVWVARSISRPISDLRVAADAAGRHEPPRVPDLSIPEIREVAEALAIAAEERTKAET